MTKISTSDIPIYPMKTPEDHKRFLDKSNYPVPNGMVTPRERDLLHQFGYWMEALVKFEIPVTTEQQCRFVMVDRGELPAKSEYENAWVNLKKAKEVEAQARQADQQLRDSSSDARLFLKSFGIEEWDYS